MYVKGNLIVSQSVTNAYRQVDMQLFSQTCRKRGRWASRLTGSQADGQTGR